MPAMPNHWSQKDSSLSPSNTLQIFTACHVATGTLHSIWDAGNEFEDIEIGKASGPSTSTIECSSCPGPGFDEWAGKILVSPDHSEAITVSALFEHKDPLCSSMTDIST